MVWNSYREYYPKEIYYNNNDKIFVFVPIFYWDKNGYEYNIDMNLVLVDTFKKISINKYEYSGDVVGAELLLKQFGYIKNDRIIVRR